MKYMLIAIVLGIATLTWAAMDPIAQIAVKQATEQRSSAQQAYKKALILEALRLDAESKFTATQTPDPKKSQPTVTLTATATATPTETMGK